MSINKQKVEEFEKKYKEAIFSKIGEAVESQQKTISLTSQNAKNIGQLNVDIPNASISTNNKIVEISQEFKKAGISMFSHKFETYDIVSSSLVGDAIIQDLMEKLGDASERLVQYNHEIANVYKTKNEKLQALQNVTKMRKLISKIRSFFVPTKPNLSLTEEERNTLDTSLQIYKDADDKICNYNLEENIVPALVKLIAGPKKIGKIDIPHHFSAYNVPSLLDESVIPNLKKLGYEHLIPELQEALIQEYKKDLPNLDVAKEDIALYVPDFNKNGNKKDKEITKNDYSKDDDILLE